MTRDKTSASLSDDSVAQRETDMNYETIATSLSSRQLMRPRLLH
jgi:hypothetical protein